MRSGRWLQACTRLQKRTEAAGAVAAQRAKADRLRREKAEAEAEIEKKNRELQAEAAVRSAEVAKLEGLRRQAREMPGYWEKKAVRRSDAGLALHAIRPSDGEWAALSACMSAERGDWLNRGRDVPPGHPSYSKLALVRAWRVENTKLWQRYVGAQHGVVADVRRARQAGVDVRAPDLKLRRATDRLPARLEPMANEVYLLHGTKAGTLLSVLSGGPNERYSGGLFGEGSYFAEDPGKNDQYVYDKAGNNDSRRGSHPELHKLLYAHGQSYPDPSASGYFANVYYLVLCRVMLGAYAVTVDGVKDRRTGDDIFAVSSRRELAHLPGVTPVVHQHGLIGETGGIVDRRKG